jgi:hypothetical protein
MMTTCKQLNLAALLCCVMVATAWPSSSQARQQQEAYFALAKLSDAAGHVDEPMRLYITQYTSDEEAASLAQTLQTGGPGALLDQMRKQKKGRLVIGRHPVIIVSIVRSHPAKGGRRIVAVMERPIAFFERRHDTRSRQYEFGIITLQLDDTGKGSGKLLPAAKFRFNSDRRLVVETLDINPIRLLNVKPFK